MGFSWSKDEYNWSEKDVILLTETIQKIYKKPSIVTTKDYYYWISHYIFEKKITPKQVKRQIFRMLNDFQ